jgi:mono/diheme cytochrome c family protein
MRLVKFAGIGLLIIVLCAAVGAYVVYAMTTHRMNNTFVIADEVFPIPSDAAAVERGRHLAQSLAGCTQCHGEDLGGAVETDIPPLLTVRGPNLTAGSGSVTLGYTNADWIRAIRHGVNRQGRPLVIMPSNAYANLTTADVGAIIAAVKTYPPVERTMEPPSVGPVGRVLMLLGQFDVLPAEKIDHARPAPQPVSFATAAEEGHYLVASGGCSDCHRKDLSGGRIPGTPKSMPVAANLTPKGPLSGYSESDFKTLFRTGKRPNGTELHEMMPWKSFGKMSDPELAGVYAYLQTLPPAEMQDPE